MTTTILSIQSHVAYGHVGNSASVFPMQRLGVEVWPVHTVNFSNHTGYGAWRGPLMDPADVAKVMAGQQQFASNTELKKELDGLLPTLKQHREQAYRLLGQEKPRQARSAPQNR